MKDVFSKIHEENGWWGDDSVSGKGSNLEQTKAIRTLLPIAFKRFHVKTLLDIPCGDFFWFKEMWPQLELERYYGFDIVPALIEANKRQYGQDDRVFVVRDATTSVLPKVDLILCRDMLGHFSNADVKWALANFRRSGSTYLLATTFPGRENIREIETGEWRPINLASMFGLPNPMLTINENCTEADGEYADKSLGLWKLN